MAEQRIKDGLTLRGAADVTFRNDESAKKAEQDKVDQANREAARQDHERKRAEWQPRVEPLLKAAGLADWSWRIATVNEDRSMYGPPKATVLLSHDTVHLRAVFVSGAHGVLYYRVNTRDTYGQGYHDVDHRITSLLDLGKALDIERQEIEDFRRGNTD